MMKAIYYKQNVTRTHSQVREGAENGDGLEKEREEEERRGRWSAEAGRAESQARIKAEQERKPYTQDMLEEHRSCQGHAQ
jgi:hypothetical protein